ncbi:MAG: T9SS type A sorting domain-containing protein [Nonlabens sp.]|jgi:cyanophycinase-like exopeptidase|uniref:T9SS type A sorting domain-containing protein n=1 Tax=Nonlabens sp. TaxID=1888209 RepID=UPI0035A59828
MLKQFLFLLIPFLSLSQNYTSYKTGSSTDLVTNPAGGVCLMGGATEDDNAMRWFLQRANGGDIVVLRASGSDGYNTYLYTTLNSSVNSVETIVCHTAAASHDAYVIQKINQAEAIWFAGGDQWDYVSQFRNSPLSIAINNAITQRNIVIGGTSAGMAIMGEYYFSAQNGTITSTTALNNPYASNATISNTAFLNNIHLQQTITDTHFDSPDRKGRISSFMARIYTDTGIAIKAIACDEYTAVCINPNGMARVYGDHPSNDDNAYFIQSNCELVNPRPENCAPSTPLTWNYNGAALKVYQIKGTGNGANFFDLNNWQTGSGGNWIQWSVSNGSFMEEMGTPIYCVTASIEDIDNRLVLFSNPVSDILEFELLEDKGAIQTAYLYNLSGTKVLKLLNKDNDAYFKIPVSDLKSGVYFLSVTTTNGDYLKKLVID